MLKVGRTQMESFEHLLLARSCNSVSRESFAAKDGSGMDRFAPVEPGLFGGNVAGNEHSARRPFAHDVPFEDGTEQPIGHSGGEVGIEQKRLSRRQCEFPQEWR